VEKGYKWNLFRVKLLLWWAIKLHWAS